MKRFDKTIHWRDLRELAACAFVILVCGFALILGEYSWMTRLGYLVLVLAGFFIGARLK